MDTTKLDEQEAKLKAERAEIALELAFGDYRNRDRMVRIEEQLAYCAIARGPAPTPAAPAAPAAKSERASTK